MYTDKIILNIYTYMIQCNNNTKARQPQSHKVLFLFCVVRQCRRRLLSYNCIKYRPRGRIIQTRQRVLKKKYNCTKSSHSIPNKSLSNDQRYHCQIQA